MIRNVSLVLTHTDTADIYYLLDGCDHVNPRNGIPSDDIDIGLKFRGKLRDGYNRIHGQDLLIVLPFDEYNRICKILCSDASKRVAKHSNLISDKNKIPDLVNKFLKYSDLVFEV